MNRNKNKTDKTGFASLPVTEKPESLTDQMNRLKSEGYSVFPASMADGQHDMVSHLSNVLNFSGNACRQGVDGAYRPPVDPLAAAGGFMTSGVAVPTPKDKNGNDIGTPGKGYIAWGSQNNLPNLVSLANQSLVYTALPLKFNIDTLCGLGVEPVYRFHATVGCNENAEEIAYEHAGSYIQSKIQKLRTNLFNLLKDHEAVPCEDSEKSAPFSLRFNNQPLPFNQDNQDDEEVAPDSNDELLSQLHNKDGLGYKRHADKVLDDMIISIRNQIRILEKEYKIWARTNTQLNQVIRNSNPPRLTHDMAVDMASFYINFTELCLSQDATRQKDSAVWKPRITAIRYRDALSCRLEEKDDQGISRHVYISNQWLDPTNLQLVNPTAPEYPNIAALPALDPTCAAYDLESYIRRFRNAAAAAPEEERENFAPVNRPTRFMLPVDYRTSGRYYYPQPAYYTIYRDVYQFAANIIRDRAIRKQNEAMFTYVLYVHQGYLERLTNQISAQKTEAEKKAIRQAEIQKIKDFLSSKQNNGSTLAAVTFTGNDGKDHDAFRIERVEYANSKNTAEANKTEISDISGIIMFAFECHPDLIGSTPGGASSSGGTYQREMLLIKQSKVAPMQNLMLYPWFVTRDFNGWDSHLSFRIKQRVLTTLDNSKTGTVDE